MCATALTALGRPMVRAALPPAASASTRSFSANFFAATSRGCLPERQGRSEPLHGPRSDVPA